MPKVQISAQAESSASPSSVFRLLRDGATWPRWSLFDSFQLERRGQEDPLGVGAIRVFITKVSRAREEVVEIVPNKRLSYILLSGFPFRDYKADVDLVSLPNGGTLIRWRSSFYAKHFGTAWLWKFFMQRALSDVSRQLARAAEDPAMVASAEELSPSPH
jgi:hypothetical protein